MKFPAKIYENKFGVCLLLLGLVLLLYAKTFSYDYALDDYFINTDLPQRSQGIEGLLHIFKTPFNKSDYRPFLILSYAIENYVVGEPSAPISHIVNVVLYYLLCVSIYAFMCALPLEKNKKLIALIVTILFLVHPIHTNVICNLKSRDNILSMLFGILSCIPILMIQNQNKSNIIVGYLLSSFLFVCAILSKYDAVGFMFFIPFLLIFFYGKSKIKHAIFIFILLHILQTFFHSTLPDILIPKPTNEQIISYVSYTENPFFNTTFLLDKIAATAVTFYYYLKFLAVPYGYWYYFGFNQVELFPFFSWQAIACLLLGCTILGIIIYYFKRNKLLAFGFISLLIFLLYCLNFIVPVAGIIADRYAFIGSLGFCICVVAILFGVFNDNMNRVLQVSFAIVVIWSIFSYQRAEVWKDSITLVENDAPQLEQSYEGQRIAAMTYKEKYDATINADYLNKALYHIQKANAIYPENSVCHIFEGIIYYKSGKIQKALHQYQLAQQNDTTLTDATELIGDLYYEQNQKDSALYLYNKIWEKDNSNNAIVNKISTLIYETKGEDSVLQYNKNLIKSKQDLFAPYENLGYLFLIKKDTSRAKQFFDKAVQKGMNKNGVPTFLQ
ncbi:MAG: hypothetical protein KDD21_04900 [Bacteroidetes bacterium]|nr:hypothetical protein [Bacteroidota bacterium]